MAHTAALVAEPVHGHSTSETTSLCLRSRLRGGEHQRNRVEGHQHLGALGVEAVHRHHAHRSHQQIRTIHHHRVLRLTVAHAQLGIDHVAVELQLHLALGINGALRAFFEGLTVARHRGCSHILHRNALQTISDKLHVHKLASDHLRRRTVIHSDHTQLHVVVQHELRRSRKVVAQGQHILIAVHDHRVVSIHSNASRERNHAAAR